VRRVKVVVQQLGGHTLSSKELHLCRCRGGIEPSNEVLLRECELAGVKQARMMRQKAAHTSCFNLTRDAETQQREQSVLSSVIANDRHAEQVVGLLDELQLTQQEDWVESGIQQALQAADKRASE